MSLTIVLAIAVRVVPLLAIAVSVVPLLLLAVKHSGICLV